MSEAKWAPTTTGGAIVKDGSSAWFIIGADGAQEIADYLNDLEAECARYKAALEEITAATGAMANSKAVVVRRASIYAIARQALEPTAEKA